MDADIRASDVEAPTDELHIGDAGLQKMRGSLLALLDNDVAGGNDGAAALHHRA
jgi:hypothetical protein